MSESIQEKEISVEECYEQAKKEKPVLGSFLDSVKWKWYSKVGGPDGEESVEESNERRLQFLELCDHDVDLNKTQKETVKHFLETNIWKDNIHQDQNQDSRLLIVATYINSLKR